MKQLLILTMVCWSITNISAFESQVEPQIRMGKQSEVEEYVNTWMNNENARESSGGLRGFIDDGEEPNGNLTVPVGMLPLCGIILLSSLYGVHRRKELLKQPLLKTPN